MLRFITGEPEALKERLISELRAAPPEWDKLIVLVPEQYTLQAELDVFAALDEGGSFRIQVMSASRLYSRVFEDAGRPKETRIDERGRAMLMYRALKSLKRELRYYADARSKSGFCALMAAEVKSWKQAGYAPESLRELAAETDGALTLKLNDLAAVWEEYEALLAGRFLDGEDELERAAERMPEADFLRGSRVWAHGFELISPSLARALIALERSTTCVSVTLALGDDKDGRDDSLYAPVKRSLDRLAARARACHIATERVKAARSAVDARPAELSWLSRELYLAGASPYDGPAGAVQLIACADPNAEARAAAAIARLSAMERGWRYRDMAIVCFNMPAYLGALERECALYGVPLFAESSRPAAFNPLCRYVLGVLRLIADNFREAEAAALMRTGYTGLTDDECDILTIYALEHGVRGSRWKKPFARGAQEDIARAEPLRARFIEPIAKLETASRAASCATEQLEAIWALMEDVRAFERLEGERARLSELGRLEAANECAQMWGRLLGALDQLNALLGAEKLPLSELCELLEQSLEASDVKPLPQSGDALTAGSLNRLRTGRVKALVLLGAAESKDGETGLLQPRERAFLTEDKDVWLAPDAEARAKLRALDVKAALAQADAQLIVTYPLSDSEGGAARPGALIAWLRRVLPAVTTLSERDERLKRALMSAREPALAASAAELRAEEFDGSALAALAALGEADEGIARIRAALGYRAQSEPLPQERARALYGALKSTSATRLERFASCPFKHFASYGLRPEPLKPYAITPRDEGEFFHSALERFFDAESAALSGLDGDEAAKRMDAVTDELIAPLLEGPLGDSALARDRARFLARTARRAARTTIEQLRGSKFTPCAIEARFGGDAPTITLHPPGAELALEGRIDRVDHWPDGDETWLRVIDYKSGMADFNYAKLYLGLQLQLMIYLAVATERDGAKPAGAFYFKVADPVLRTDAREIAAVEALRANETRMSGPITADERAREAIAPSATDVVKQFPRPLAETDFALLISFALERATKLATGILSGETDTAPIRLANYSACEYCDYKLACLASPPARAAKINQREALELMTTTRSEADV